VVEPEAVEELREKLGELAAQPAQDWYSHSSLEAGENLRDQAAQSIESLRRGLESSDAALAAMRQASEGASRSELERMQGALDRGIQGLEMGGLPLERKLLGELKALDPSKARKLTAAQAAQMRQRLKEGVKACAACTGGAAGPGRPAVAKTGQPGKGGIDRGPGTVPLGLAGEKTELGSGAREGIANDDLSRALPGDALGVGLGEHEIDESHPAPAASGAAGATGQGGDTVWRDALTPAERGVLKRFFK
jgi:hypothetical protein